MGKEREDFATGQISALLVAVRALIHGLSDGDVAAFQARFVAESTEYRDRMVNTHAEETYFEGFDETVAYVGNSTLREPR